MCQHWNEILKWTWHGPKMLLLGKEIICGARDRGREHKNSTDGWKKIGD